MEPSIIAGLMLGLGVVVGYQIAASLYRKKVRALEADLDGAYLNNARLYKRHGECLDQLARAHTKFSQEHNRANHAEAAVIAAKAGENG